MSNSSPYGVLDFLSWDHEWNSYHYRGDKLEEGIALMKEAGVGFVRVDFLWEDIEPKREELHFEKYERLTRLLSKHGIQTLGLLSYNASWAAGRWNAPPDPALFLRYAAAVAAHFKNEVKFWEVWNEPDEAVYWGPQDELRSYAALLKKVYPVLKKESPSSTVLMGCVSHDIPLSISRLYALDCGGFFDVVNIHPFINPLEAGASAKLKDVHSRVHELMRKNGDAKKPVWLTEIGCPGVPEGKQAKEWWMGRNPTEAEQAEWVRKVYVEPLRWEGVEKIFWAFFRDAPDHFKNGIDYFGLVREDFSKKPAFEAYQEIAISHY